MVRKIYTFFLFFAVVSVSAFGQTADEFMAVGDSLHRKYNFQEAKDAYTLAFNKAKEDSLGYIREIEKRMMYSDNGINMSLYADSPKVIAKRKFSKEDFFLYYPLRDSSWRRFPNQLESRATGQEKALYFPQDAECLYYSSSEEGSNKKRNIFYIERRDSVWTSPVLADIHLPVNSDIIYPILSPSGKELYFSSEGLYGVGGYDIYVSHWDEQKQIWSEPVNMGFPYSSPSDDFLYVTSDDERYNVFASDRECSSDSLWVYVLEYNNIRVRKQIADSQELLDLSRLEPSGFVDSIDSKEENTIPENVDTRKYLEKISQVRALRDTISLYNEHLDRERNKYALSNDDDERLRLTTEILKKEEKLPVFQDSLKIAMTQLQKIEMEFLFKGVVIDPEKLMAMADDDKDDIDKYDFAKKSYGPSFELQFESPRVPERDLLQVLSTSHIFIQDNSPQELTYQIEFANSSVKLGRAEMKGLSPVFQVYESGSYKYLAGQFSTYAKAEEALLLVQSQGYPDARILAFSQGKEIGVESAKKKEN